MKQLLKTKTFYTGLALIAYGVSRIVSGDNEGIQDILTGLGLIFLRDAMRKDG